MASPIRPRVRLILFLLAGLVFLTIKGGTTTVRADNCLQCITRGSDCTAYCDCHCDNPSLSISISGCDPNGGVSYSCADYSVSPPLFGSASCDSQACAGG